MLVPTCKSFDIFASRDGGLSSIDKIERILLSTPFILRMPTAFSTPLLVRSKAMRGAWNEMHWVNS